MGIRKNNTKSVANDINSLRPNVEVIDLMKLFKILLVELGLSDLRMKKISVVQNIEKN